VESKQLGRGFGARANEAVRKLLELPLEDLLATWEGAARRLLAQKMALDEEINKEREVSVCGPPPCFDLVPCASLMPPVLHQTEQIKRTHDYTPFIQQYVTHFHHAGILHDILEIDENGQPLTNPSLICVGPLKRQIRFIPFHVIRFITRKSQVWCQCVSDWKVMSGSCYYQRANVLVS